VCKLLYYLPLVIFNLFLNKYLVVYFLYGSVGQLELGLHLKFCGGNNNLPFQNIVHSRNKIIQRKEERGSQ
jgi:hypothetical protein